MITYTCLFHYATSSNLSEINFIVLEESLLFNSNNSGIANFTFSINASYELHIASSEELPKVVGIPDDVTNSKVVKKFIPTSNNNN